MLEYHPLNEKLTADLEGWAETVHRVFPLRPSDSRFFPPLPSPSLPPPSPPFPILVVLATLEIRLMVDYAAGSVDGELYHEGTGF